MKATKKQELARKRNWALYQVKSAQGNLIRAMTQAGTPTHDIELALKCCETLIKKYYLSQVRKLSLKEPNNGSWF